jgi:hypothetical protein
MVRLGMKLTLQKATQGIWKMQGATTKETNFISVSSNSGYILDGETRIRNLFEKYCTRDSDPQCCSSALLRGAHVLHGELSIRVRYHRALERAFHFKPEDKRHWGWYPLIDTPFLRLGLIGLHRVFSIPLHDHPNAYGVVKVISGQVRAQQYQFAQITERDNTLVSLKRVSESVLSKGKSSVFTPSFRNLHDLESLSSRSVLLSMLVNPYRPQDRSWYFQVPHTLNGNMGLYNRIRRKHSNPVTLNSHADVKTKVEYCY